MTRYRLLMVFTLALILLGFTLGALGYIFPGRLPDWLWKLLVIIGALGPLASGVNATRQILTHKTLKELWDEFAPRSSTEPPVSQPLPELVGQGDRLLSCFISYSSRDQAFAERLHTDLQDKGVRCWFAPEDMKIGDRIRPTLDASIQVHDKLLLILSKHSVESDWVEQEVETALARERQEKRTVLFPVRLDDAVMEIEVGWPALIRNTRHIGDFRHWKDHSAYQQAFGRLLRDLKAEGLVTAEKTTCGDDGEPVAEPEVPRPTLPVKRILAIIVVIAMSLLLVAAAGGILRSTWCGSGFIIEQWGLVETPFAGDVTSLAVNPKAPSLLYAGTLTMGAFQSQDRGMTWLPLNLEPSEVRISTIAIDPEDPSTVYLGSNEAGVFKSIDNGYNWTPVNVGLTVLDVQVIVVDPRSHDTVYVGTWGSGVFKSKDRGSTWTQMSTGLTDPEVQALAVDPSRTGTLYAGTNNSGVFKTVDGARTWSRTGLTNVDVRSLFVGSPNSALVYATTWGDGVFITKDGGKHWIDSNAGLTDLNLRSNLVINPQDSRLLYVGTWSRGVFASVDGGITWLPINSDLVVVRSIVLDPEDTSRAYVGSVNGVFRFKGRRESFLDCIRQIQVRRETS